MRCEGISVRFPSPSPLLLPRSLLPWSSESMTSQGKSMRSPCVSVWRWKLEPADWMNTASKISGEEQQLRQETSSWSARTHARTQIKKMHTRKHSELIPPSTRPLTDTHTQPICHSHTATWMHEKHTIHNVDVFKSRGLEGSIHLKHKRLSP